MSRGPFDFEVLFVEGLVAPGFECPGWVFVVSAADAGAVVEGEGSSAGGAGDPDAVGSDGAAGEAGEGSTAGVVAGVAAGAAGVGEVDGWASEVAAGICP